MNQASRSLLLGFSAIAISAAATLTYTPAPTTDTGWNTCDNIPGQKCRTTAYFEELTLNDQNDSQNISSLFNTSFDTWNATGGGQGWTLNFGGDLDGSFKVTIAKAMQFELDNTPSTDGTVRKGGLEINIDVSGITLPRLGGNEYLVWSQGLFDNYLGSGTLTTPFYEMDGMPTGTGGCTNAASPWCLPAYPYTYPDNKFYDRPAATYQPPGPQAFFDANAYLSVINYTTKTLTVYDGVAYGFQNYVAPEPGAWILFVSGLGLILVMRKRRVTS